MRITVASILLWLVAFPAQSAEIEFISCDNNCSVYDGFLYINGEIETGDLYVVKHEFRKSSSSPSSLATFINSQGGDVYEAMRIGRWLRTKTDHIAVNKDARCLSACVLILASGNIKHPIGTIGIHRPYLTGRSKNDVRTDVRTLLNDTRNYLDEMNVPVSLADEMFSTPPNEMKILSEQDLRTYRLDQADMVWGEETALDTATRLGISREEYMKRMQALKKSGRVKVCEKIFDKEKASLCSLMALMEFGLLPVD